MISTAPGPAAVQFERPADDADLMVARAGRTRFLDVPERRYLMIDGRGEPGSPDFQAAFGALYPVAYTLHFALKRRGIMARVGALEGLYWFGETEGPIEPSEFDRHGRDEWKWRLMLPVPEAAGEDEIEATFAEVARKKAPAALPLLRIERWAEGPAAQTLHVGSYASEPATIEALHAALAAAGLRPRGCHHEIYISDPNRTAPERLKTIIRQPVEPAAHAG
jgi:hypothetical protein